MSTDALFITSVITAHERWNVASTDIHGAFLHANNDERVTMRLNGILAKMMVKIAPGLYRPFITANANDKPVLYANLKKVLYRQLKSALLTSLAFQINPYDPCMTNKVVNGKQMTIIWHVDDLLVSHGDFSEVDKIIEWLSTRYKTPNKPLKATRGAKHDYLGMMLEFKRNHSLVVGMDQYIH